MNRELRRAQQKADDKQQKEKRRVKQVKREKREAMVSRRKNRAASKTRTSSSDASPGRRSNPGRFARTLSIVTAVFIIFQSVPVALLVENAETVQTQSPILTLVVKVLYYLMFGYFSFLWAARTNAAQALNISMGAGLGLAAALLVAQFAIPAIAPELLVTALAVPAVVLGALGGRLVWRRA